jgi:PAS domain S-box-containing protein
MDAIITIDSAQRVTLFNAAAERMLRWSAAEVLGQGIDRFIPERNRAVHRGHIWHFGTTGEITRAMGALGARSAVWTDGEELPIEASISKVEIAGHLFFYRHFARHDRASAGGASAPRTGSASGARD